MLFLLHLCILKVQHKICWFICALSDNFADTEVQVLDVFLNIFIYFQGYIKINKILCGLVRVTNVLLNTIFNNISLQF